MADKDSGTGSGIAKYLNKWTLLRGVQYRLMKGHVDRWEAVLAMHAIHKQFAVELGRNAPADPMTGEVVSDRMIVAVWVESTLRRLQLIIETGDTTPPDAAEQDFWESVWNVAQATDKLIAGSALRVLMESAGDLNVVHDGRTEGPNH